MADSNGVLIFQILATASVISLVAYLLTQSLGEWIEERIEIAAGGRIQKLCKEFQCSSLVFRMALENIVQENTILRTHIDGWVRTKLPSVVVSLLILKWIEEHKGLFKPFVERVKESIASFITHMEKLAQDME